MNSNYFANPSLTNLLFSHWFQRLRDIQRDNGGTWQGDGHPKPICLHVEIDKRLNLLRPIRDPNEPIWDFKHYDFYGTNMIGVK